MVVNGMKKTMGRCADTVILLSLFAMVSGCWVDWSTKKRNPDPLADYDLGTVTNVILSPVYDRSGDQTIAHRINANPSTTIAECTTALQEHSRWQQLVRPSGSHWFATRKLKLTLQNSRGDDLNLWVEFHTPPDETVARFDRIPITAPNAVPECPMADTASTKLGEMILQMIKKEHVKWVEVSDEMTRSRRTTRY